VALVAAACSSSKSTPGTSSGAVKQGGSIVLGAEQEPHCMDWIGSCGSVAWGIRTVETNTMPRAYDYTASGYKPGTLLTGEADLKTSPKQVVTYHINPKAVWSDNQPITSTDFNYTWDQIVHGQDINDTTGYSQIESVDHTDPHTAVVTFSTPFPNWRELFGAFYGVFPSHLLQGHDRDTAMKDGYTWSGGPWLLDHWTKTQEIVLKPNANYWGKRPNLDSVIFKFITDTAAEQQDFKSGQVLAIYPQPQPGQEALKGLPGTYFDTVSSLQSEGIWFNLQKAPLDDVAVRQALAYATDRDAIVAQLFAPVQPGIKPIQSVHTPAFGAVYTEPFAKYKVDLGQVTTLMTGAGWAKGSDGIWAKGGTKASLELKTTSGNKRRALTAQLLQDQWHLAGFQLNVTQESLGALVGHDLANGNFQIGLYAQQPSDNDPGESGCIIWCSKNIPGPSNGNGGENWDRLNDPRSDQLWTAVDTSLDKAVRIRDAQDAVARLAELVPVIPLDAFPDIVVVNTDRIGVEGGTFQHNLAFGPFTYLNTWFAK